MRDLNAAPKTYVPGVSDSPWANALGTARAFDGIKIAFWDSRGNSEGRQFADPLGGAPVREIPLTEYFS